MIKRNIKIFVIVCFALLALSMTAFASVSGDVMKDYYYNQYGQICPSLNAPYTADDTEAGVDEKTASMFTRTVDYKISGKNGFDLPFVRYFKSNVSSSADDYDEVEWPSKLSVQRYYYKNYKYSYDNSTVPIYFRNEREVMEAEDTFIGKKYGSGIQLYRSLQGENGIYTYTLVPGDELKVYEKEQKGAMTTSGVDWFRSSVDLYYGWRVAKPSLDAYYEDYVQGIIPTSASYFRI